MHFIGLLMIYLWGAHDAMSRRGNPREDGSSNNRR